jgi:hypothetical protein
VLSGIQAQKSNQDSHPLRGQRSRDRRADPLVGTGNEGHTVAETRVDHAVILAPEAPRRSAGW